MVYIFVYMTEVTSSYGVHVCVYDWSDI